MARRQVRIRSQRLNVTEMVAWQINGNGSVTTKYGKEGNMKVMSFNTRLGTYSGRLGFTGYLVISVSFQNRIWDFWSLTVSHAFSVDAVHCSFSRGIVIDQHIPENAPNHSEVTIFAPFERAQKQIIKKIFHGKNLTLTAWQKNVWFQHSTNKGT